VRPLGQRPRVQIFDYANVGSRGQRTFVLKAASPGVERKPAWESWRTLLAGAPWSILGSWGCATRRVPTASLMDALIHDQDGVEILHPPGATFDASRVCVRTYSGCFDR
jgi:hypothetical protein